MRGTNMPMGCGLSDEFDEDTNIQDLKEMITNCFKILQMEDRGLLTSKAIFSALKGYLINHNFTGDSNIVFKDLFNIWHIEYLETDDVLNLINSYLTSINIKEMI